MRVDGLMCNSSRREEVSSRWHMRIWSRWKWTPVNASRRRFLIWLATGRPFENRKKETIAVWKLVKIINLKKKSFILWKTSIDGIISVVISEIPFILRRWQIRQTRSYHKILPLIMVLKWAYVPCFGYLEISQRTWFASQRFTLNFFQGAEVQQYLWHM